MLSDVCQDVSQPSLRIDIIHLGGDDQTAHPAARCPPQSEPANSQDVLPENNHAPLVPPRCLLWPAVAGRPLDQGAYPNGLELGFSRSSTALDNAFTEAFNARIRADCLNAS